MSDRIAQSATVEKVAGADPKRVQSMQRRTPAAASEKLRVRPLAASNHGMQRALRSGFLQAKLTVNRPGDIYEQEADRVAEQVMRMPESAESSPVQITPFIGHPVQRCSCGKSSNSSEECAECKSKALSRYPATSARSRADLAPPIVHEVLSAQGQPLNSAIRNFMEPRFGVDFSGVRIHTDPKAAESARAVDAMAYTVGRDVVVGSGQYTPASGAGLRILIHELTHVVQQGAAARHNPPANQSLAIRSSVSSIQRITSGMESGILQRKCEVFSYPGRTAGVSTVPGKSCVDDQGVTGITAAVPYLFDHFAESDSTLSARHRRQIAAVQSGLTPTDSVEVHGYASCDGTPDFNLDLSCTRAEAVASALGSGATPFAGTMQKFAHGETDEFGTSLEANRRVIVKVTHAAPSPPTPPPTPPTPIAATCLTPPNPDESGRAFNPTTATQASVWPSHPVDSFRARACANDAFAAAGTSGFAGPHLGPQDAFRHCFWNCCMAATFGAAEAEEFATSHENSGPSPIPFDNQMDLHDNSIGRGIATSPTVDCAVVCTDALNAGRLRTIRGPAVTAATGRTSPVTTDCIGASNQFWP
jgi:hypothetical protein